MTDRERLGAGTTTTASDEELTQDQLLSIIAGIGGSFQGDPNEPELIGGLPLERFPFPTYGGHVPGAPYPITTRYLEYDQWALFAGKSPEFIVDLQSQMIAAGLIDEDDISPGFWGAADASPARQMLTEATAAGVPYQRILQARIRMGAGRERGSGGAGRRFVAPTYLAPDYATLAQASKNAFEQLVGRPPKDYEMALLADQLAADSRREYEAEVAAARAEFVAQGNHPVPEGQMQFAGGATVQGVDPMARLREAIQARYGPEIAAEEGEADFATNTQLMMRNLAGLEGIVS